MLQANQEQWSMNDFNRKWTNPDQDYKIIALKELLDHLSTIELFDIDVEDKIFIPRITYEITNKAPDVANPSFRVIVQLVAKLPIKLIPNLFDQVFAIVIDQECEIRTQTLSILQEAIINSVVYSLERQNKLIDYLLPRLSRAVNEAANPDNLFFSLDLLNTVMDCLGNLIKEEYLASVLEIIKKESPKSNSEILPLIATLSRLYCPLVSAEKFEEFTIFLNKLENKTNAHKIIAAVATYKPLLFAGKLDEICKIICSAIDEEEAAMDEINSKDEDFDRLASNDYVSHISEFLDGLASLTNAFPDELSAGAHDESSNINSFISYDFSYLAVGANDFVEQEDDDDIDVDADDDFEAPDSDDVEVITGDGSWKIRKSAMKLAASIIKSTRVLRDLFLESLVYRDEEWDNTTLIDKLIKDTDEGSQTEAMQFLLTIIHAYSSKIEAATVSRWIDCVVSQFRASKAGILPLIIDTLTAVLVTIKKISTQTALLAINKLSATVNETTLASILSFFSTLFSVISSIEIIQPIIKLFINVLNNDSLKTALISIVAASQLFIYANDQEKLSKEIKTQLDKLNQKILSLSKNGGERMMYSIPTLNIFSILYSDMPSAKSSTESIVKFLENEAAVKPAAAAICLIAVSPSAQNLLGSWSSKLYSMLSVQLNNVDSSVVRRTMWAMRLLLENKLMKPEECKKSVPKLIEIVSSGDNKCKHLALDILTSIRHIESSALQKLHDALTNIQLPEDVVYATAELLSICAKDSMDAVKPIIESLIKTGPRIEDPTIASNVALIIGAVGGINHSYAEGLVSQFEKQIATADKIFALHCLGELGAFVDLGSNKKLVDTVFSLVSNSERAIFSAAAECAGLIAAGSIDKVLPRLLSSAESDQAHVTIWLLSIGRMVKKLSNKRDLADKVRGASLQKIANYLLSNADYSKEHAQTVSQCLADVLRVDQAYVDEFIKNATKNDLSGPVAIRAISSFFETAPDNVISGKIKGIIAILNKDKPILSEYVIQCLKNALLHPRIASSLFCYIAKAAESVTHQPSHLVTNHYGTQQVTVDIGHQLRQNAADCLALYFETDSKKFIDSQSHGINFNEMFDIIIEALKDENTSVQTIMFGLISNMTIAKISATTITEHLEEIIEVMKEIDPTVINPQNSMIQLENAYYKLLITIRGLTEKQRNIDIETLYARHKRDPRLTNIETELSFSSGDSGSQVVSFSIGHASHQLMLKYYPEAADIFTN